MPGIAIKLTGCRENSIYSNRWFCRFAMGDCPIGVRGVSKSAKLVSKLARLVKKDYPKRLVQHLAFWLIFY